MITVCMILAIILAPVLGADQERGADWLQTHTLAKLGSKSRVQQVRIALGPGRQTTQRLVERYMQAAAEQRPVQHIQTQLEASKRRMTTAKAHLMKEFNMILQSSKSSSKQRSPLVPQAQASLKKNAMIMTMAATVACLLGSACCPRLLGSAPLRRRITKKNSMMMTVAALKKTCKAAWDRDFFRG